jgi:hypothetical protein
MPTPEDQSHFRLDPSEPYAFAAAGLAHKLVRDRLAMETRPTAELTASYWADISAVPEFVVKDETLSPAAVERLCSLVASLVATNIEFSKSVRQSLALDALLAELDVRGFTF